MFDKNTINVLKYLDKCIGHTSYQDFQNRFSHLKNPNLEDITQYLYQNDFIDYDDFANTSGFGGRSDPQTIVLTLKGKQELEKHLSRNNADKFARVTSILALLISLASLVVSYFKR